MQSVKGISMENTFGDESGSEQRALLIKSKLLVSEEEVLKDMLDRTAEFLQIDRMGRVYLKHQDEMRKVDAAAVYLLGISLAKDAGLAKTDMADADEIGAAIRTKKEVAAARLHDLVVQGRIESPERGKFRIILARASETLSDVKKNLKGDCTNGI